MLTDSLPMNATSSALCLVRRRRRRIFPVRSSSTSSGRKKSVVPDDASVPRLLSSQAAISLENALLCAKPSDESCDRRKTKDDLRRSEAVPAEAQQINHTGSWRWKVGTGEVSWSAEQFRIFAFDPATTRPSYATFMERMHPEDRPSFEQAIQRAVANEAGSNMSIGSFCQTVRSSTCKVWASPTLLSLVNWNSSVRSWTSPSEDTPRRR
jgi:hypothetical protein